jgi:sarcosine oxidase subunit beta
MTSPDVLVIGSGVIGASIAWHLASLGAGEVLVIDRESEWGGGSTGRATGGFRAQFSTAVNIGLSLRSREKLLRFPDEIGVDSGYRAYGYLFLARSQSVLAELRAANALQRACGVPEARMIGAEEAQALNPAIRDDQLVGGTFSPSDGFVRPREILRGYVEAAQRLGVRFELGLRCNALRTAGDRIVAVETPRGTITAGQVVNAAGAWAGELAEVPVRPLRRQVAATVPTSVLPESMPMTIWADDGYHLRVRDGRVLLLQPHEVAHGFDTSFDEHWLERIVALTAARVPSMSRVPIDRAACWSGLYEMSPDRHAILGRSPRYANLWLANGSSGHGVMHAPAIGQIMAELMAGQTPSVDVHPLRPTRFAEHDPIASSEWL